MSKDIFALIFPGLMSFGLPIVFFTTVLLMYIVKAMLTSNAKNKGLKYRIYRK